MLKNIALVAALALSVSAFAQDKMEKKDKMEKMEKKPA